MDYLLLSKLVMVGGLSVFMAYASSRRIGYSPMPPVLLGSSLIGIISIRKMSLLNLWVLHFVNSFAGKFHILDSIMVFTAKYSPYIIASVLFLIFVLGNKSSKSLSIIAAISGVFALLLNQIISALYYSPRPSMLYNVTLLLPPSNDASFPSDHTALAFAVSVAILSANKRLGILLILFSLLTGVSRVYCGLHYPVDILGGMATGITSAALIRRTAHKYMPALEEYSLLLRRHRR